MNENPLVEIWRSGRASVNAWLHIPDPFSAEVIARIGFNSVTCDMQHGLVDYASLVTMFAAMSGTGVVPVTRVPSLDPALIGRVLDAGALGVICPMINSAEDARTLVASYRYAPEGKRSFGPNRAGFLTSDYVKCAADLIIPFAMIETREALANLDEILAVDGLKAIYVGPADLSLSMGHAPKVDPIASEVIDAIVHIGQRAREQGIVAGIHTGSSESALRWIGTGYQFVSLMSDRTLLERAASRILREVLDGLDGNIQAPVPKASSAY